MSRRQIVWVLPAVTVTAACSATAEAKADEMLTDAEDQCRECGGLGVTPCELNPFSWAIRAYHGRLVTRGAHLYPLMIQQSPPSPLVVISLPQVTCVAGQASGGP